MDFFNNESGDFNPLDSCGEKLREVKSWGGVEWDSTAYMFYGCSNLTKLPSKAPNLSKVVNMSSMFQDATNFNQDISGWNVSNVKYMSSMFAGATNFNQDISGWNVSNVLNMPGMFYRATNFNQPLDKWGAYLGRVNDMEWMFWGAGKFTHNIDSWPLNENVKLDNFIHKYSAYEYANQLPLFCQHNTKDDSDESVCLSDTPYKPEESDTAQSSEPAEGD